MVGGYVIFDKWFVNKILNIQNGESSTIPGMYQYFREISDTGKPIIASVKINLDEAEITIAGVLSYVRTSELYTALILGGEEGLAFSFTVNNNDVVERLA